VSVCKCKCLRPTAFTQRTVATGSSPVITRNGNRVRIRFVMLPPIPTISLDAFVLVGVRAGSVLNYVCAMTEAQPVCELSFAHDGPLVFEAFEFQSDGSDRTVTVTEYTRTMDSLE
jgi:hypothetical protein